MDVNEASRRLDEAIRRLSGCENKVNKALSDWRRAEAARSSHLHHHKMKSKHGDNYRQEIEKAKDLAIAELNQANARYEKAQTEYDETIAASKNNS